MKKLSLLLLVIAFAVSSIGTAFAASEWVQLTRSAKSGAVPEMKLITTRSKNVEVIEVTVPGFYRETKPAGNQNAEFTTVGISSKHMEKGLPEIPAMKTFVALPEGAEVEASVISEDWAEIAMKNAAAPSKGQITRNVNPEEVNFEYNDFYNTPNTFPGMDKKVVTSAPFVMRDVRGVEVSVNPFQYDNAKKAMKVAKRMRIELRYKNAVRGAEAKKTVPYEFAEIYKNTFMNFVPTDVIERLELGNILVISHDSMLEEIMPLVEWKKKQGFGVKVAKMSEIGATADDVYKFIKAEYAATKMAYIILVGDSEFVPTLLGVKEKAASDPCYTKLAGDDHVPDAMISRISAKNAAEVKNQVARIIHYEQFPYTGDAAKWYRKAVGIASNQGTPTDFERANQLRDGLMKFNFDVVDQNYDPTASKVKLSASINEGRSLINYIGHGSKTSWVTTSFGNAEALALKNDRMLPVIWSVACVNGAFNGGSDCFCEAWMKAGTPEKPAGAAAIFGSSTNAEWVPPCDMQSEINLVQAAQEKQSSVGALALTGILKGMQIWGTAANSSGVMLFEQYNIFGDCSMQVRNDVPKQAKFTAKRDGDKVVVNVTNGERAVKYARVAVSMGANGQTVTGITGEDGNATLSFNSLDEKNATGSITVTGQNLVPVVDSTLAL
ncbi:MAG TPA: C25 family cysteine peptidase [Candidatus Wallbacteria bacterium]|nr:C25 family cysteine peptidase [Candidatus Wallbacteria bacterium]